MSLLQADHLGVVWRKTGRDDVARDWVLVVVNLHWWLRIHVHRLGLDLVAASIVGIS